MRPEATELVHNGTPSASQSAIPNPLGYNIGSWRCIGNKVKKEAEIPNVQPRIDRHWSIRCEPYLMRNYSSHPQGGLALNPCPWVLPQPALCAPYAVQQHTSVLWCNRDILGNIKIEYGVRKNMLQYNRVLCASENPPSATQLTAVNRQHLKADDDAMFAICYDLRVTKCKGA